MLKSMFGAVGVLTGGVFLASAASASEFGTGPSPEAVDMIQPAHFGYGGWGGGYGRGYGYRGDWRPRYSGGYWGSYPHHHHHGWRYGGYGGYGGGYGWGGRGYF